MKHGAPDNYQVQKKSIVFRLDDMAELAVRLGSIDMFNRLGDVIFIDGFEDGLSSWDLWDAYGTAIISLCGGLSKSGGFCCSLIDVYWYGETSFIYRGSAFSQSGRIGFEYSFCGNSVKKEVAITIDLYDGVNVVAGYIKLNTLNKTLEYFNADGDFTVFAEGVNVEMGERIWNVWKLVVDLDTREYVKLILNQAAYSLKDIGLRVYGHELGENTVVSARMTSLEEDYSALYIDNCILTQNEP